MPRIAKMKSIAQIRRERLKLLVDEFKGFDVINVKLGRAAHESTLRQILNETIIPQSHRVREMTDVLARSLELACGKETFWCDRDPEIDALETKLAVKWQGIKSLADASRAWPFKKVARMSFFSLPDADQEAIESHTATLIYKNVVVGRTPGR